MENLGVGFDLVLVLVAAFCGGLLARRLRLPIFLGYLIGGIVIGPSVLGLVSETETINNLATIGLVLMLFTIGLEFSLPELKSTGKVAVWGGIGQVLLTAAAGLGFGSLLGWGLAESIFFGFIIAQTSTAVVFKVMSERGELGSTQGRIVLGISLMQDMSTVPLLVVLPVLAGFEVSLAESLVLAIGKALLFIAIVMAFGVWILPRIMAQAAATRSRELFVLFIVVMAMVTAFAALIFGLSAAIGGFVAGVLIGQSMFARQALANIIPLRDIFGVLFFVSLGMLADISDAFVNPGLLLLVIPFVLVVKFIIGALIPWVFGFGGRTSILTGMGLIPMGEFSFILASTGLALAVVSESLFAITVVLVAVTMVLTPFLMSLGVRIYRWISHSRWAGNIILTRNNEDNWVESAIPLSGHAVICGHGRTAEPLTKVLQRRNLSFVVIEIDPQKVTRLRQKGIPCVFGDASNMEVLSAVHLERAKLLVCTFPAFFDVETTVRNALRLNPKLDIVARVERDQDAEELKVAGVSELVKPQFEASLEITRHALHRYGVNNTEIQYILNSLRQGKMS